MNNWKNSLSCWCFVYDVLHRVLAFCLLCVVLYICMFSKSFIPIYRGFERRWEFSRYINLSCLKLWFFTIDLLPDLIIILWRTNFKFIPFETEQRLQQYYCYSCLDVETSCRDSGCRGVRRVSGRIVRTLYFVNSGEVGSTKEVDVCGSKFSLDTSWRINLCVLWASPGVVWIIWWSQNDVIFSVKLVLFR